MYHLHNAGEEIKGSIGWVGGEVDRQIEWTSLAARWKAPPADAAAEDLFPKRFGEFERGDIALDDVLPQHNIGTKGRKAVYRSRAGAVELYALRATSLEREVLFKRLLDSVNKRGNGMRIVQGTADSYRLRYTLGPPDEKGFLWWNQDWLFVALSREAVDVEEFLRTYLDVISREVANGPKK
jgi:hypothetical protein